MAFVSAIRSILIVGAGLIGTSAGLALRGKRPSMIIDAVEPNASYRAHVRALPDFSNVYATTKEISGTYDLVILATPPNVACDLLPWASEIGLHVMDVCSIKRPICDAAAALPDSAQFTPSHPMAGKAIGGPTEASAELFEGRPWLFLDSHVPPQQITEMMTDIGAQVYFLPTADTHDQVVGSISHGIHLTSLAAMIASGEQSLNHVADVAGPAFWDITRLATSPSEFWVDTLMANRSNVLSYLERLSAVVEAFRVQLEHADPTGLRAMLDQAREMRTAVDVQRMRRELNAIEKNDKRL